MRIPTSKKYWQWADARTQREADAACKALIEALRADGHEAEPAEHPSCVIPLDEHRAIWGNTKRALCKDVIRQVQAEINTEKRNDKSAFLNPTALFDYAPPDAVVHLPNRSLPKVKPAKKMTGQSPKVRPIKGFTDPVGVSTLEAQTQEA